MVDCMVFPTGYMPGKTMHKIAEVIQHLGKLTLPYRHLFALLYIFCFLELPQFWYHIHHNPPHYPHSVLQPLILKLSTIIKFIIQPISEFIKGQLILEGNFSVFNSPQKTNLKMFIFAPSLLRQKFFVRFLGELKKSKCPFEINWPLESADEMPRSLFHK